MSCPGVTIAQRAGAGGFGTRSQRETPLEKLDEVPGPGTYDGEARSAPNNKQVDATAPRFTPPCLPHFTPTYLPHFTPPCPPGFTPPFLPVALHTAVLVALHPAIPVVALS